MLLRTLFATTLVTLVSMAALSAQAAQILIDRLECAVPEDMTVGLGTGDECKLMIYVDGVHVRTMRFDLDARQSKLLNLRFEASTVQLVLFDEDSPDGDDNLGTVTISADTDRDGRKSYNGHTWQYFLNYRIERTPSIPTTFIATLDSLRCGVTEDSSTDQCLLQVWVDGVLVDSFRRDMKASDLWDLGGRRYTYRTQVTVRLWDLDNDAFGGGHDRLGDVGIGQFVGPNRGGHFGRDGASYDLRYRVTAVR